MPQLIQHIDKICREKQRDVLFLTFDRKVFPNSDWLSWRSRSSIIDWLDKNNIKHLLCGDFASEQSFSSYKGQIYIDVPYDETNPDFVKLSHYLEYSDGRSKIEGVTFCYLPLEQAMKNKHHDVELHPEVIH